MADHEDAEVGFILGGLWLLLALLRAVGGTPSWPMAVGYILAALFGLLGVGYLVTAELLRRRQRSSAKESDRETEPPPD